MYNFGDGFCFWHREFEGWYGRYNTREDAERAWKKYLSLSWLERINTFGSTYLEVKSV